MRLASSPTDIPVQYFVSFDGARMAWREVGEGRPVVLIHGFFSDGVTNWIRYGHAAKVAAEGFRVIMPDLRAHGSSARPHDAASYPHDALADDGFALVEHLGLTDFDLGGYSLGARTVVRMLVRGAAPGKAIISGMGWSGLVHATGRSAHFAHILENLGSFEKFTPEWNAEAFLRTTKGDPIALRRILDTVVDTPADAIRAMSPADTRTFGRLRMMTMDRSGSLRRRPARMRRSCARRAGI